MSVGEDNFVKEFEEMGRDRVRSDLMLGRFSGAKRTEARVWLERADAADWQAKRAPDARPSLMNNEKIKKMIPYLAGAAFLIMALSRLVHH